MRLARHVHEAEVRERGEHRRTGPDHHVVAAVADVQPQPVARALVAAEERGHPVAERLPEGASGGRHRCRLGDQHERATTRGEARGHGLDGEVDLVLGRRAQHERGATAPRQRGGEVGSTRVPGPRTGGVDRRAGGDVDGGLPFVLGRHPGRRDPIDHGGERCHVPPRHPSRQGQAVLVEEAHGRDEPLHREHPRRHVLRGTEDPAAGQLPVEADAHQGSDPGAELRGQVVGERLVERKDGPVQTDRDRPVENFRRRRRCGARRRDRRPPRGTPCDRSARTPRCRGRSGGAGRGRG